MDKQYIGRIFKSLRIEKGFTQPELIQDFESKTGIRLQKSAVSMYENGKRLPEIELLTQLADYFSVTVDYMLGRSSSRLNQVIKTLEHVSSLLESLSDNDRREAIRYLEYLNLSSQNKGDVDNGGEQT